MKLLLVTDAWKPQTNGVVTTLGHVSQQFENNGMQVYIVHPGLFRTLPIPFYREIDLAIFPRRKIKDIISQFQPDFIHVATEGPLGISCKRYLDSKGWRYTTSLHTRFPEYVNERVPFLPVSVGYKVLHWFHRKSQHILVTTPTMKQRLAQYQFEERQMVIWGRGVDTIKFKPKTDKVNNPANPILLYVGRLAVEKNVKAFLDADVPGQKVIVGDGPLGDELRQNYPEVNFIGYKYGEELVDYYASADVFVFPSRTDTFGLVMLEAMACGTPVAAYPEPGPVDVIQQGITGVMSDDLAEAINDALKLNREDCRQYAESCSWEAVAHLMHKHLTPLING